MSCLYNKREERRRGTHDRARLSVKRGGLGRTRLVLAHRSERVKKNFREIAEFASKKKVRTSICHIGNLSKGENG